MKWHWIFLNECRKSDLASLAAPVLVLSASPIALDLWSSLYLWDKSHHLYFYYCKVKEKIE